MSKAFTRESDDAPDEAPVRSYGVELPAGAPNYMTPAGAARQRDEIDRLIQVARPALLTAADTHALHEIDRRIAFLRRRIEALEVVDPASQPPGVALFGATIVLRDEDGNPRRCRIVGVDEASPARGDVSWTSPLAKALLGAKVGDVVTVRSPRGDEELEVIEIGYPGEGVQG
jgi:transcription elongation factor GreB